MKKENEKSALRLLKFDTVGEDVAVAPEQSAGVYGATGRESPLAPPSLQFRRFANRFLFPLGPLLPRRPLR